MKRIVLIRHAEPRLAGEMPSAERPLSAQGRVDARLRQPGRPDSRRLDESERRRETQGCAALAPPAVRPGVRDRFRFVARSPGIASADQHASALGRYLDGGVVPGWESREDVLTRLTRVQSAFGLRMENVVLVSHGVLLTTLARTTQWDWGIRCRFGPACGCPTRGNGTSRQSHSSGSRSTAVRRGQVRPPSENPDTPSRSIARWSRRTLLPCPEIQERYRHVSNGFAASVGRR